LHKAGFDFRVSINPIKEVKIDERINRDVLLGCYELEG
jgi:hypothetical protein